MHTSCLADTLTVDYICAEGDLFDNVDDKELLASWGTTASHGTSGAQKKSGKKATSTSQAASTAGGLFGDSDSDDDAPMVAPTAKSASKSSPAVEPAAAAPAPKPKPAGGGGGGLFGDSDDEEDGGFVVAAKPAAKPAAPAKSSGGLFGGSDSDDDGGPLLAAAVAPAPVPKVAAAAPAPAPAPAPAAKPSGGGGLFGDDSDDDSDAAGLFGGGPSKPAAAAAREAAAAGGLFSNAAASDDDSGLFGSAPAAAKAPGAGASAAPEPAAVAGQWDQSLIGSLIDMGFARVDAEAALSASSGDVQQAADWLLVGGTAAAAERTSQATAVSEGPAPSPAPTAAADGGLDQTSAFLGVTVFTRPAVRAPEPAAAGVRGQQQRPSLGDRVTVSQQPRNSDFLQPGQVGTVVEIDDMDVEDIWFTVEDADGETDEYCEADLAIADGAAGLGAAVAAPRAVPSLDQLAPASVPASAPPGFSAPLQVSVPPGFDTPVEASVPSGFSAPVQASVPPGFSPATTPPDSETSRLPATAAAGLPVAAAIPVAAAVAVPSDLKPTRGVFSDSDDEDSPLAVKSTETASVFDEDPSSELEALEGMPFYALRA